MPTIIVGTLVFGAFAGVGICTFRKKKKTGSCCSGCKGCANAPYCQSGK